MSHSAIPAFDTTIQLTNTWIHEIMEELGWQDRHRGYQALRAVLHAIRDRLTISEIAHLGAQLPLLVRGIYYEGWNPSSTPAHVRQREEFLAPIADTFREHPEISPEGVVWAVFKVMERHISTGEIHDVKHVLPEKIRVLCP